jgi:hypothetical protein
MLVFPQGSAPEMDIMEDRVAGIAKQGQKIRRASVGNKLAPAIAAGVRPEDDVRGGRVDGDGRRAHRRDPKA